MPFLIRFCPTVYHPTPEESTCKKRAEIGFNITKTYDAVFKVDEAKTKDTDSIFLMLLRNSSDSIL